MPPVTVETDIDRALDGADVVMALRLQSERQDAGLLPSLHEYSRLYQVTEARLARAKPNHLLMHPGPKNEGVEIAGTVAAGGSGSRTLSVRINGPVASGAFTTVSNGATITATGWPT